MRRSERIEENLAGVTRRFNECVTAFESSETFAGPSLYFHERALERRRMYEDAESLLADTQFLEYVYAVLPAWGMHRMGKQAAKVVGFDEFATSLRAASLPIQNLWDRNITDALVEDREKLAVDVWSIIDSLKVSSSNTKIVAGSKTLHHVLPNLVPPIDREYTFWFFTGQKSVSCGDKKAFLEWFPILCDIGGACRIEIATSIDRGGFMATGPAKVIDNAIMGFKRLSIK